MSESLRSVIIQELRSRFPAISWKLGSLVRELVVEPLAKLGDLLDSHIQKAEAGLDITTICQSPATNKEAIDTWMSRLGLTTVDSRPSKGKLAIMSETGENMTILAGTVFMWGDDEISLVADEDTVWGGNGRPYTKHSEGAYMAEISVTGAADLGGSLSSGVPVNWEGAPSHVYDIYTSTAITGGRPEQSYQEKADMIMNALSVKSFVGEDCISNALQREFPGEIVDAVIVGGKNTDNPYTVNLTVKSFSPPTGFTMAAIVQESSDGNTVVVLNSVGIATVDNVLDVRGIPCPVVNKVSSDSTMTLTLKGVKPGEQVTVYCTGMEINKRCSAWLSSEVQGLPFVYNLVDPLVAVVSIYVPTTEELSTAAKVDIQAYVNAKPLDGVITDSEINAILDAYGVTVNGAIIYSLAVTNMAGSTAVSTTTGGLSTGGNIWAMGRAVAMYTFVDKIFTNA